MLGYWRRCKPNGSFNICSEIIMTKCIIYKNEDDGVSVVYPTPEALETMTIEEIAAKDVPAGVEFKIVDVSDIPTDRTFRNAWEYTA